MKQQKWQLQMDMALTKLQSKNMDYTTVGCCALAFVLYLNTLSAGFVYDDRRAILTNTDVIGSNVRSARSGSGSETSLLLHNLYAHDFWGTPLTDAGTHGSWRPLCVLSFRLNFLLGGGFTPWTYHLVNNLLHCLATALVIKVARTLTHPSTATGTVNAWGVAATGALFAVHPIHTEAVASIVGRADLCACICYLLTYLLYLQYMRQRAWQTFALTLLCACAALLFKETAITALVICGLCDLLSVCCSWCHCAYVDKQRRRSICFLAVAFACLVYYRLIVIPRPQTAFAHADNPIAQENAFWTRFLTFAYLPVFNFNLLLNPQVLSFDWGMEALLRITSFWDARNLLSVVFYSVFTAVVWRCVKLLWFVQRHKTKEGINSLLLQKTHAKRKQNARDFSHLFSFSYCAATRQLFHVFQASTNDNNNYINMYCQQQQLAAASEPFYTLRHGSANATLSGSDCHQYCSTFASSPAAVQRLPHVPTATQHARLLLISCAFLVLPFLPATNLFFYVGFVVAERLLYLPSVGYCLLIGFGLSKLLERAKKRRQRQLILFAFVLFLFALSIRTVRRNMDWHDEASLYRSAVPINPPKALANLGSVLSSQGRYAAAKDALNAALHYRPNMADVHFNLGILEQNHLAHYDAVACFKRAIHFRPSFAAAHLNLGISLLSLGKRSAAAEALQLATRLTGLSVRDRAAHEASRAAAYLQLGALYAQERKLQRSLAVYREALESLPQQQLKLDIIYQRMADLYAELGQLSQAEHFHRAALTLQPKQVAAHLSYGMMLARNSSRIAEAEMWFKRAMELAPSEASVFHYYAEFLTLQARQQEAVIYHQRAAELAPDDFNLVIATADALRLLKRYDEAERWYRKAVSLRPNDASTHANLGAFLQLRGQMTNALKSYRRALSIEPQHANTLANLAKLSQRSTLIKG